MLAVQATIMVACTASGVAIAATPLNADSTQPKPAELVLEYEPRQTILNASTKQQLEQIEKLLQRSRKIGNSYHLSQVKVLLGQLDTADFTPEQLAQYRYYKAQYLQKDHQFKPALKLLALISAESQYAIGARLLASRLHLLGGDVKSAIQQCSQLLSSAGPEIMHLCLLETKLDKPETEQKFVEVSNRLNSTSQNQQTDQQAKDSQLALRQWLNRLGASIALSNGNTSKAIERLERNLYADELYDILLWADLQLEQTTAQINLKPVYDRLSTYTTDDTSLLEDAILLRLARLENILNMPDQYQKLIHERIALRLVRQDRQHSADLAYYYLHLKRDPEQALAWAKRNWQSSKDLVDLRLKTQAEKFSERQKKNG